ncbi:single-stranded-DNA-specific exonuclease RecJ [Alteromonas sp. a30]|uniref:single-stranded-DNA-specific exonuclease RecJ n=1 Tax=Alteromonas sp. a30 TaxID=2730917 RepID=UPI0022815EB8|nr:single-stranded-DNA-specific exonuclease RecJ [Alteromonas sp. a30]MCY7294297.1 single-stranded-DNA-specific exonuclease RecJ [Alteromonas sp. a30]
MKIQYRPPVEIGGLPQHLHPIIQRIYASRGVLSEQDIKHSTKDLLHYDGLKQVELAVELLTQAIKNKQKIMIIGDFDADGATSTAVMVRALTMLGCVSHHYLVPNRFEYGYGLSPEIVTMAHQQGAEVIVTVDNGIACLEGVSLAKSLGLQVIITDHHLPAEALPNADAIVNPNQRDCAFPSKNLAGVGVAFYLMMALRRHLQQQHWFQEQSIAEPNLGSLLDLVALGTVADVVPLDTNNRILVHQGVQRIKAGKCAAGINALLKVAQKEATDIDSSTLGFVLGPRLNAAGRLDDMSLGIQCLLTDNPYEAIQLASKLDSLNSERKEIESGMQKEAEAVLNAFALHDIPHGIVLYEANWHQGIIGIVAGRVKDKYYRPTIVFAEQDDNTLKGSARSIPGLHIRDVLEELNTRYPGVILKFGGHAAAAGLAIEQDQLTAFTSLFNQLCEEALSPEDLHDAVYSDGSLPIECLSLDFAQQLKTAGPWGQGFPEPIFDGKFRLIQHRVLAGKHLKLVLQLENSNELIDAIMFNVDPATCPASSTWLHVAYKLDINRFRGKVSLQMLVEAIEVLS